jgi:hypothetical protein
LGLGAAALAALLVIGADVSTWPELRPPQGGFSIRMPDKPTETTSPEGVHNFQLIAGQQSYIASYSPLPPEMRKMSKKDLLHQIAGGFLQMLPSSRMISSSPLVINGNEGISCVIESKAEGRPVFRLKFNSVVTTDRIFNYSFISPADQFDEAAVDKYLATFQLR